MRWIRQRINNIKLQNKLASIYIVTGLIPLFVLFAFAFGQMRSILMDRDLKSMQGSLLLWTVRLRYIIIFLTI